MTAVETFGFTQRSHQDWFDQNNQQIRDLLEKKNKALVASTNNPSSIHLCNALSILRSETHRTLREMQNDWWNRKAQELQSFADQNDLQSLHAGIKAVYGPLQNAFAPLNSADGTSLIKDRQGILGHWVEYLSGLLNTVNPINPDFIDRLPTLPLIMALDITPSYDEVHRACQTLKNNKSPGPDRVPGEVFKFGGEAVTQHLFKFIEAFWGAGFVPQSMKDPIIVMMYKKKGNESDCGNYRGISAQRGWKGASSHPA